MAVRAGALYREKAYTCGEYKDVYIYPVYPARQNQSGRRRRRRPTREVQKKLNQRHAREKFARLLHANFTSRDLSVGLSYAIDPESRDVAMKDLQKFLRRLRYRYRKLGIELKYLWQMEISSKGRYHFHVVLSGGMDRDEIEQLWGHGYANTKRLQPEYAGLAPLSGYISKSHHREEETRLTYRSYNGSKNLVDPPPKVSDTKIGSRKRAAELADEDWNLWNRLYPGYELVDIHPFHSDEYGSVYIFARLRRTPGGSPDGAHGKKTRGGGSQA